MTTETTGAAEAAPEVTTPVQEPIETAVEVVDGQEHEAEPTDEAPKPPPKPKLSAQQRIDQLTWRANEAERRAQEAEARAAEIARFGHRPQPTATGQDAEPNPEDYEYGVADPSYIAEVATRRATALVRQEFEARQAQERQQAAQRDFIAKRNAFAAKVTDQNDGAIALLTDKSAPVTDEMAEVLFASEAGVAVADHLGRNYAEARRIASLPPHLQGVELGRLEARLTTAPKTLTTAPEPPPTVRGAGGRFQIAPDTSDFGAFDKQFTLE